MHPLNVFFWAIDDYILDENTWLVDTIILLKVCQEGGSFCYVNSDTVEM